MLLMPSAGIALVFILTFIYPRGTEYGVYMHL